MNITLQFQHYMAYPKSTKQPPPLRPIISSIGSATHKIARTIAKYYPFYLRLKRIKNM